jgi:antitoxin component YwqK of YwqJK toxin-antitoxin module
MKDGSKFKGHFKGGMKHGKCVEEAADGTRFEGSYANNVRDGAFVEKDRNGNTIRKGYYKRGRIETSN